MEVQSGQRAQEMLTDSGYSSERNLECLDSPQEQEKRLEGYMATRPQKHGERRVSPGGHLPQGPTRGSGLNRNCRPRSEAPSVRRARRLWNRGPAVFLAGLDEGESRVGLGGRDAPHFEDVASLLWNGYGENKQVVRPQKAQLAGYLCKRRGHKVALPNPTLTQNFNLRRQRI
jgi:hypothetical protein